MSDLDKMMDKLKKTKKTKVEDEKEKKPEQQDQEEDQEEQEDDEDQEEESATEEKEEDPKVSIEEEVAILQNDGIFRRETLGAIRELINVQMVNAQALIDLNKLIGGALNGKK